MSFVRSCRERALQVLAIAWLAGALCACQAAPSGSARVAGMARGAVAAESVHRRLAEAVALRGSAPGMPATDYRVGPGDVLEISVFQAEELDRTVRVRPDGTISLPLLGLLDVAGKTTAQLEDAIAARFGADYLRDPKLSVFVREYRAHPISVLGEVNRPGVYYLREPRSLVAMLSEAGGLTKEAGTTVYLRRKKRLPEPSPLAFELIRVDLRELLKSPDRSLDPTMRDHDTVFVPRLGVVFVQGAVRKPGAYPLHGDATVLKAVTMAGGLDFAARASAVRLIRAGGASSDVVSVDIGRIRNDPSADVPVNDGDIVVVGSSALKVGMRGLWRGITGLVNVSKGL